MDNVVLKFPHLFEQIIRKLNNESLFKSREVTRSWTYLINERNYPWLCLVNIPTVLQKRNTYLHLAAASGQLDAFKAALCKEEDKNIKNSHGLTFFHLACIDGRFNIVEHSIKSTNLNIDVNVKTDNTCNTGFILACQEGHSKVVKILKENALTLGIDLNTQDRYSCTGFYWACQMGHLDVIKLLLENAASVDLVNYKTGETAFHVAGRWGHTDVVKILTENAAILGLDLNTQN